MKEQFADVKVGDRVWSVNYGWGEVSAIHSTTFSVLHSTATWYMFNGIRSHYPDCTQTLFWDETTITPPEKPKREVTHRIERWVNVYPSGITTHQSEEVATSEAKCAGTLHNRIACVKLTGTYTTME